MDNSATVLHNGLQHLHNNNNNNNNNDNNNGNDNNNSNNNNNNNNYNNKEWNKNTCRTIFKSISDHFRNPYTTQILPQGPKKLERDQRRH